MKDIEQVQEEARERAIEAAREGQVPFVPWPGDYANLETWQNVCRRLPYLGTYTPPGWLPRGVDTVLDYPYEWFFVDATGLGGPDEPALDIDGFRRKWGEFVRATDGDGRSYGLSIAEVGQFQVQIQVHFTRNGVRG